MSKNAFKEFVRENALVLDLAYLQLTQKYSDFETAKIILNEIKKDPEIFAIYKENSQYGQLSWSIKDHYGVMLRLYELAMDGGAYEFALTIVDRMLKTHDSDTYNYVLRMETLMDMGLYNEALLTADRALQHDEELQIINPESETWRDEILAKKADVFFELGDSQKTEECYDELELFDPAHTALMRHRLSDAFANENVDMAVEYLKRIPDCMSIEEILHYSLYSMKNIKNQYFVDVAMDALLEVLGPDALMQGISLQFQYAKECDGVLYKKFNELSDASFIIDQQYNKASQSEEKVSVVPFDTRYSLQDLRMIGHEFLEASSPEEAMSVFRQAIIRFESGGETVEPEDMADIYSWYDMARRDLGFL